MQSVQKSIGCFFFLQKKRINKTQTKVKHSTNMAVVYSLS